MHGNVQTDGANCRTNRECPLHSASVGSLDLEGTTTQIEGTEGGARKVAVGGRQAANSVNGDRGKLG